MWMAYVHICFYIDMPSFTANPRPGSSTMRDEADAVTPYNENSPCNWAIWEFFGKDNQDALKDHIIISANCNHCGMSVPRKQGCTSYMKLHLGDYHLQLYKEYISKALQYIEEQVNPKCRCSNNNINK